MKLGEFMERLQEVHQRQGLNPAMEVVVVMPKATEGVWWMLNQHAGGISCVIAMMVLKRFMKKELAAHGWLNKRRAARGS